MSTRGRTGALLAWLAALLLVSGATRLVVVCAGPHAGPTLEIAHVTGHCGCVHDEDASENGSAHAEAAALDRDGNSAGHSCCVDEALLLVPWSRPRAAAETMPPPLEPAALEPPMVPWPPEVRCDPARGPGPSPPPASGCWQLARSVVLLI